MKLTAYAAVAASLVLLSGCSERPQPAQVAQCLLASASPELLVKAGSRSSLLTGHARPLDRTDVLGCAGGFAAATDEGYRQQVSTEFAKVAAARKEFRSAWYAQLPGVQSDQSKTRARELGTFLEDVSVTRREILRCGMADAGSVAAVSELDATFVLAAIGRYVGVNDFGVAKAGANTLIEMVGTASNKLPRQECDAKLDARFRDQVKQWAAFYEGGHPWAPGCSVKAEDDAFVLTCN